MCCLIQFTGIDNVIKHVSKSEVCQHFYLGMPPLANGLREQLEKEYGQLTRASVKRALLDKLANEVKFELPKSIVDGEFDTIWKQIAEAKEKQQYHLSLVILHTKERL